MTPTDESLGSGNGLSYWSFRDDDTKSSLNKQFQSKTPIDESSGLGNGMPRRGGDNQFPVNRRSFRGTI